MLSSTYQVERTAAAGSPRSGAGFAPAVGSGVAAASGHVWTAMSVVIPTTKRHDLNPAPRPEEAVPR